VLFRPGEPDRELAEIVIGATFKMQLSAWSLLDYLYALIMLVSTGFAIFKGLTREIISMVALIAGFVLAAWYYPAPAKLLVQFARSETVADFVGFLVIFVGCLVLGALTALLVRRFVKMASLEWVDYLLGGVFGFVRGWAVCSVIVLALVAFPVQQSLVERSVFAPYLLAGARAAALVVPRQMKDQFYEQYKKILEAWNQGRNPA
jgi:membrane protein required for colicin V production